MLAWAGIPLVVALLACYPETGNTESAPGLPLPGLTDREVAAFANGEALFNRPYTPEEGLGPLFNQDRCSSCHDLPTSGGHGAEPVSKVSAFHPDRGCSTLPEQGGDLLQQAVTETARRLGLRPETIPSEATAASDIRAPAVYGLGLVAAIPEADVLERADPDDRDGDGISGRPNFDDRNRVGRFGRKGQHSSLTAFVEEAIRLEMGLTTPEHPEEGSVAGLPIPGEADPAPDPEVGPEQLAALEDYLRFLAPPERRWPTEGEDRGELDRGERIFRSLGCTGCHTPSFTTGPSSSEALNRKRFRLYSDLLLHDMGPGLADICSPETTPSEWKTARLVGLGHRSEFLHDGRAQRLEDAVLLHGGEASAAQVGFSRLTPPDKAAVLRFLQSL